MALASGSSEWFWLSSTTGASLYLWQEFIHYVTPY